MNRQDRQGVRTASDLERKYNLQNLGKPFAEVLGIATDARRATIELDEKLESEISLVRASITEMEDRIVLSVSDTYAKKADLTLMSDSITAKVDDLDGRTSTLEQTADGITANVTDLLGRTSQLETKADGITAEVTDLLGRTSQLEITSEKITADVTDLFGRASTLEQKADSITAKVEDLDDTVSQLELTAESLTASVESLGDDLTNYATKSELELKANELTASVTAVEGRYNELSGKYDDVYAELSLKLDENDKGELISMIEAQADEIVLEATNRIKLEADEIIINSKYFELSDDSRLWVRNARVGGAYFTDDGTHGTSSQIYFMDDGIYLFGEQDFADNRSNFIWENADGTDIFRMRGYTDGLHLEGLVYSNTNLDLVVFGMSIREMYNKIQELSEGGLKEILTLTYDEENSLFSWNSITGATVYGVFIDGAEYESVITTSYDISYDTFLAMFGEYDHPVYITAKDADGNELAMSNIIWIVVEGEEKPQTLNLSQYTDSSGDIWLKWNAIDGATGYVLKFYDSSSTTLKDFTTITDTSINVSDYCANNNYDNGTYTVKVQAVNTDGDQLAADEISVTITTMPDLNPVVIEDSSGITVSWDDISVVAPDVASRLAWYTVFVYDTSGNYVDATTVHDTSVNMARFNIGTETYNIVVEAKDGGNVTIAKGSVTVTISAVG